VSPPPATPPAGGVTPLPGDPEGVVIDAAGTVAVNVHNPDGLVLFDLADPAGRHTVVLPGSARHLALAGRNGPLLVPEESTDRLVEVSLPSGSVLRSVPVGRQPHDAAPAAGGRVFVGDELADTVHVVAADGTARVVPGPVQPGGVAAAADGSVVVVVGVRGRRLSAYRPDGTTLGSVPCGAGPTHVVAGLADLFWVVDTDGGAVLGFRVGNGGPRPVARIPVGGKPYGVAFDAGRSVLWLTLTATDQLVALHLDGLRVARRSTYATVRQPDSVAVDAATGQVVVTGSTSPGAIEVVTPVG